MQIDGAKFLITGGSSGIGKATARMLIEKGGKVIITGRDEAKLMNVAEEVGAIPFKADVGNEGEIEATYKFVKDTWGGLDCLVNNAGVGKGAMLSDLNFEVFEEVFKVNVYGAAVMAKKAAEMFKKQNYGHIVNIASTAALKGYPGSSVYGASKFALRGMTQAWQTELRKHNVRVIGINPSEVPTAIGNPGRKEREEVPNKLTSDEIAHSIVSALEMDDRGFIPELSVWATNPF